MIYDWANSATSYWDYTQIIAMVIIALFSPIMGTAADYSDSKNFFLGIAGMAVLFFVNEGNYLLASFFFIIANVGFSDGNVFYDGF